MGKSAPSPPASPSPQATAAASTSTNVATAISNAFLNNTNQVTPDGSLNYDVTGDYNWQDPYTGLNVDIPTFTATQTLSPQQQQIQDQANATKMNLAGMANAQSSRLSQWLSGNIDTTGAPAAADPSTLSNVGQAATSFNVPGQQQTTFDTSGTANPNAITNTYGSNMDVNSVQKALLAQMQPQLDVQKEQLQQQLADQGIKPGSAAYNAAFVPFNQQQNNAYMQSITGATGQYATEMGVQNQLGTFQNSAQQQAYNEQQGIGQFANQAQQNQFQQAGTQADYYNAGLAQQLSAAQDSFNAQNMARNQYMNETYAMRNQPINEISSLLSGSQINNPNFVNTPNNQIPTTDVAGLINNKFSQDMSVYQQQNADYQQQVGGMYGMLGGLLKGGIGLMSDVTQKDDISQIGTIFSATPASDNDAPVPQAKGYDPMEAGSKELPVYQYSFKQDPTNTMHIGPMAQDVEKIDPKAVVQHKGVKYIKPVRLMSNILRAG